MEIKLEVETLKYLFWSSLGEKAFSSAADGGAVRGGLPCGVQCGVDSPRLVTAEGQTPRVPLKTESWSKNLKCTERFYVQGSAGKIKWSTYSQHSEK